MSDFQNDNAPATAPRYHLRDLPFAARLTLAAFLVSTSIGYAAAIVQLKMQHAKPGNPMPDSEDVIAVYHGQLDRPLSKIEILLLADPSRPFNGSGQMCTAFTRDSADYDNEQAILADFDTENKEAMARAKKHLDEMRELERASLLAWIVDGVEKVPFEKDHFVLPDELKDNPTVKKVIAEGKDKPDAEKLSTEKFFTEENGQPVVKIQTLFTARCTRCHKPSAGSDAKSYPLDSFATIKPYTKAEKSGGMSLIKLAQTTHVHLLGFAMLYGLTGLIFAFSSYPGLLRVLIAPAPLIAQVVDISFWWLARLDAPNGPTFAKGIMITGGIVGATLAMQIVLSMLNMFGKLGKLIIVLGLAGLIAFGAMVVKPELDRYLASEKAAATVSSSPE